MSRGKKQPIRIGLDFDGVVAYNPSRLLRTFIAWFKQSILGIRELKFIYPKNFLQQAIWTFLHESSVFPATGKTLLTQLVDNGEVEVHLITARYSFLNDNLYKWLDRFGMRRLFTSIHVNQKDEQPHLFKERMIKKLQVRYFVDDNWDIVEYLSAKSPAKILWIYNILDRGRKYSHKHPDLKRALEAILAMETQR